MGESLHHPALAYNAGAQLVKIRSLGRPQMRMGHHRAALRARRRLKRSQQFAIGIADVVYHQRLPVGIRHLTPHAHATLHGGADGEV